MASLSNDQKIAKFETSSSSQANDVFSHDIAKGISIGCEDELKH